MKKKCFIELEMKNTLDFFPYARFWIDMDLKEAMMIFAALEGVPSCEKENMPRPIKLKLVYSNQNIKEIIAESYCTLSQLERNCSRITMEIFKNLITKY